MTKYRKVGQTDHYQKVKGNNDWWGWVVAIVIILIIASQCS